MVYYNEHDEFAAAWLAELMADGAIPAGWIDTRDIRDVLPSDLDGYTHCHFFAGIGGWAEALHLAGWPPDRPVWTGSCPCQPFSAAGRGGGAADARHLWPAFHHLIRECRPPVVFGEQVDAAVRHGWVDLVHADLEGDGYAVAWADLPAASVGAPHIRQRLWWVAESDSRPRGEGRSAGPGETGGGWAHDRLAGPSAVGELADNDRERCEGVGLRVLAGGSRQADPETGRHGEAGELGDGIGAGLEGYAGDGDRGREPGRLPTPAPGPASEAGGAGCGLPGFWSRAEWHVCRDGKARPVEPGIFPLAHGVPNRVGTLRGAGNAIVPQVAAEVIRAYMETT